VGDVARDKFVLVELELELERHDMEVRRTWELQSAFSSAGVRLNKLIN
jgi:hypothetical protein